ncbi:hypothetical protein K461DRAFT_276505 [Myriangium duriaei CBS 260.36]|uniref:Protein kinase domain-containing protein n=1 Tax=Myriangium duriaei CBS 260.36 TaxID=1168546 RepID=A0A9P4MQ54_9PEZI|nr:hypothetical protein K461DRAFT_276505 [Myriangium duriaei CBS 260.36]
MAPEVYDLAYAHGKASANEAPSTKVDIWALGVTVWWTLSLTHPFDTKQQRPNFGVGAPFRYLRDKAVSVGAINVLQLMLHFDPRCRPDAKHLRPHHWIAGYRGSRQAASEGSVTAG